MTDKRIAAMINFISPGSRVADIGTDHAYLPIESVKSGRASFVIAADKNSGPATFAKKNIAAAGLEDKIEVRIGDGLKILQPGEVDTICIGGMGGKLICDILSASPEIFQSAEKIILQPMNAPDKVEKFLTGNDFFIADLDLAESGGIIYEIFFATKNPNLICRPTKKDLSPLAKKFEEEKIKKLRRVYDEMSKSPEASSSEKFFQIQKVLQASEKL